MVKERLYSASIIWSLNYVRWPFFFFKKKKTLFIKKCKKKHAHSCEGLAGLEEVKASVYVLLAKRQDC